jgi:eukaryotic-like serine/threonine-protein kinase
VLRLIREEESPRPSMRLATTEELPSIAACRHVEPRKLSGLVRGELDWIVMKALEKDRNRRFETANGLAADLRRYLDDEPVQAAPPTTVYRMSKFSKRHRVGLATAGAFGVVLVAASAISIWQAVRANRARIDAVLAYAAETTQRREAQDQRDRALKAEGEAKANQAKAISEETKAKESAAEAKAVLEFFQEKVFAAARPEGQEGGLGHGVTLRAAIDAAEKSIAVGFANKPTVEANIRSALGESYRLLGDAALALPQFERARELWTKALGPDHSDTLTSTGNVAMAYWELGRTTEAVALHADVLKRLKATLGSHDRLTLITMNNLALAYRDIGRMTEAITLHEEAVRLMKASLGTDDTETLISMGNLALEYTVAGRISESVELHEETHRRRKSKLGPDHPDTLLGMNYLASAYTAAGRPADAIAILEDAVKIQKVKLGPGHPETLIGMNNLAFAYHGMERTDDAIRLLEESVQQFKSKHGLDYPGTGITMYYLGAAYLHAKRWSDSETVLRECMEQREHKQPDDWMRFLMMSRLGSALAGQHRFTEAEPLLIAGYEGLLARESKILAMMKKHLPDAGARIVRFYDDWGKKDKAALWRAKLDLAAAKTKQEK